MWIQCDTELRLEGPPKTNDDRGEKERERIDPAPEGWEGKKRAAEKFDLVCDQVPSNQIRIFSSSHSVEPLWGVSKLVDRFGCSESKGAYLPRGVSCVIHFTISKEWDPFLPWPKPSKVNTKLGTGENVCPEWMSQALLKLQVHVASLGIGFPPLADRWPWQAGRQAGSQGS